MIQNVHFQSFLVLVSILVSIYDLLLYKTCCDITPQKQTIVCSLGLDTITAF